jgi:DNA-binding transcriptional LysR family regulator
MHRLARRRSVPLASVAEEPVVMYPAGWAGGFRDLIFSACREAGFVPRVVQEVVQVHTVLALVGAGIGIGFVPGSIAAVGAPGVAFVTLRPAPGTRFALAFDAGVESPARDRLAELTIAAGTGAMTAP